MNFFFFFFSKLLFFSFHLEAEVRWTHVQTQFTRIVKHHEDTELISSTLVTLNKRRAALNKRRQACTTDACRYWCHHSLVRNRRERRAVHRVVNCWSHPSRLSRKLCVQRVTRRFIRGTIPGGKGRMARILLHWRRAWRRLRSLGRLAIRVASSSDLARSVRRLVRRLRKYRRTLRLKRHACRKQAACVRSVRREQRRVKREIHTCHQVSRCGSRGSRAQRRSCVRHVLRRFRRVSRPGRSLPISYNERRRRQRERFHLNRLHHRAARCKDTDDNCTRRLHKVIAGYVRTITARRRAWAVRFRASLRESHRMIRKACATLSSHRRRRHCRRRQRAALRKLLRLNLRERRARHRRRRHARRLARRKAGIHRSRRLRKLAARRRRLRLALRASRRRHRLARRRARRFRGRCRSGPAGRRCRSMAHRLLARARNFRHRVFNSRFFKRFRHNVRRFSRRFRGTFNPLCFRNRIRGKVNHIRNRIGGKFRHIKNRVKGIARHIGGRVKSKVRFIGNRIKNHFVNKGRKIVGAIKGIGRFFRNIFGRRRRHRVRVGRIISRARAQVQALNAQRAQCTSAACRQQCQSRIHRLNVLTRNFVGISGAVSVRGRTVSFGGRVRF